MAVELVVGAPRAGSAAHTTDGGRGTAGRGEGEHRASGGESGGGGWSVHTDGRERGGGER